MLKSATVVWLALVAAVLPARTFARDSVEGASETKATFLIIPHTHWEGAVFKTREEYLELGLTHLLTVLRLLREHPNYRFALDQVAYFRPFLERYPEEAGEFRRFVTDGRLQIVGGLNVMPDDNMPAGESFVRQMLYAKQFCREALGTDVKTAWLIDTFGHHDQLPQVLRLGGFDSFWFSRGVENRSTMPCEFWWQGIDGSRVKTFWLPLMYANFAFPPRELAKFVPYTKKRYDELGPYARNNPIRVGFNGADVTDPDVWLPDLVNEFNAIPGQPFALRLAVPNEVESALASQTNLPIVTGERNPLFQGVYSTRIELKQQMRETERLLLSAENFEALAGWLDHPGDPNGLEQAWDRATFNVTHDLASGVMTDEVYADTLRGYDFARQWAGHSIQTALQQILADVQTAGEGAPIAVWNTLGWPRTDIAEGDVGFAEGGVVDYDLVDPDGRIVPAQVTAEERFEDGGLRRVKFLFTARNIPAMGYSIYHVVPRKVPSTSKHATDDTRSGEIENRFFRAAFDLRSGTLHSLRLAKDDWQAFSAPANDVALEPDHGDVWELDHNLDGAQTRIMTRPLPVPRAGQAIFSSNEASTNGVLRRGPVFTEGEASFLLGTNSLTTKARFYEELDRIDFETTILNRDRFVRYRVLVPTTVANGHNLEAIPFGAIERPQSQEFPAQGWIDYSDHAHGIALLNRGNPGNNVSEGTLMLSLLRSTRIQSYGIGGGFEGQSSDSALELNHPITLRYAMVPHAGNWQQARVYRAGEEFNHPLIVSKAAPHPGRLPARWGLLEVSEPNVVLSALKPGRDGMAILRVFEAVGTPTLGVKVRFNTALGSAQVANLVDDPISNLRVNQNQVGFDLHPFEIKTLRFKLAPGFGP